MKTALTIAGFDPSGGAGIQADLKTFHAHGIYGLSAVTAVTVQDTQKVYGIYEINPQVVYDQIICLLKDAEIHAVKIGMLVNTEVIDAVADALSSVMLPAIILDPVMISTSGFKILAPDALNRLVTRLFPVIDILTPNICEAEALTGKNITTIKEMKASANDILKMGVKKVVVKGGHMPHKLATDILYDGLNYKIIESKWADSNNVHGTGCTFSSAIAANMAMGKCFFEAATCAKTYITSAFEYTVSPGKGDKQFNHFYQSLNIS